MNTQEKIGAIYQRTAHAVKAKPKLGKACNRSRTELVDGLHCVTTEEGWTMQIDMPGAIGGNDSAPTPGVYGRASLGSCIAIRIAMQAAAEGITLQKLAVNVEADSDLRGMFEPGADARPGYSMLRVAVNVASTASKSKVDRIIGKACQAAPYLDVFSNPNDVRITCNVASMSREAV